MSITLRPLAVCLLTALFLCGCEKPAEEVTAASDDQTVEDFAVNSASEDPGSELAGDWDVPSDTETSAPAEGQIDSDLDTVEPETPTVESFAEQMQQSLQQGNFDEALAAAKQARAELSDDPRSLHLLLQMGMLLARTGDIDAAQNLLEELPEAKTNENVRFILMQLYQQQSAEVAESNPADALAMIQKATAIARDIGIDQPWAGDVFYDEAVLLAKADDAEKSLDVLREAFESGYAGIAAPMTEAAFANNEEAMEIIEEFAPQIRKRYRAEIRDEMLATQAFPFSVELTDTIGEPVSTEALKGKVVIVDFWGTWCPPCKMEIPHFIQLVDTYTNDLAIVGLNYREPGATDEEMNAHINEFMTANDMNYQCALGDDTTIEQVPSLEGFPTTLFLDRAGNVRLKLVGYHPYEKLEAAVLELVSEEAPVAEEAPAAADAADSDTLDTAKGDVPS